MLKRRKKNDRKLNWKSNQFILQRLNVIHVDVCGVCAKCGGQVRDGVNEVKELLPRSILFRKPVGLFMSCRI